MKKNRIYRVLFILAVAVVAVLLIYLAFLQLMPQALDLLESGNEEQIETYLRENSTFRGAMCTALLQMVQVWSVIISGAPIQIAAGVVYGTWGGFALCHLSSLLAHVLMLLVARRLGSRLEKWLPVEDTGSKLHYLLETDTPAYAVVLACLIPVLPNGFIPLIAARSNIKTGQYAVAIWGGSIPNILLCCAVGTRLIRGQWLFAAVLLAALLALVLVLWKNQKFVLGFLHRAFPVRQSRDAEEHR